jgi:hypothetical protein
MPTNPPASDGAEAPSEEPLTPAEAAKALNLQEVSIGPNNRKKAMPRGSKPGERRGGRQRGTPNKKTALRNAAIAAAASNPDITPLDFLLGVMKDPNMSSELRIKVAQVAAPLVQAKRGTARSNDPAASAKLIDGACGFTIDPILARVLRDDCYRLDELCRKSPLSAIRVPGRLWGIAGSQGWKSTPSIILQAHNAAVMRRRFARRRRCGGSAVESASCGIRTKSRGARPEAYG